MDSSELDDDDLLRRARVQPDVFRVLYERHARSVHGFLRRRVGPVAADDLLGEVFVAALAARTRVVPHGSGSALPWLYGIATNLVRAHLRHRYNDPARRSAGSGPDPDVPGWNSSVDWDAVDERVDAGARAGELRDVLADLTDAERQVLLLVAWEGLTPTESGLALGLTPMAARTRLYRARARARARLLSRHGAGPIKEIH